MSAKRHNAQDLQDVRTYIYYEVMDMSKYQQGESMSKISEFLIKHTTNIDQHSLTAFEETVIEGIIIIIILLIFTPFLVYCKHKSTVELSTCRDDGVIVFKQYGEVEAYIKTRTIDKVPSDYKISSSWTTRTKEE